MSVNPAQMFKSEKKFTKFDENGVPTHQKDKNGEKPLKEDYRKKLQKQWNDQKTMYDKYVAQYGGKQKK